MKTTWVRSVLALAATLVVAGPGLVLAGGGGSYAPVSLQILGPSTVAVNGTADYDAKVTFTNNSTQTFTGAPVIFTQAGGVSIDANGVFTAGAAGRARITGTYTNLGVTVVGNRIVRVQ